MINQADSKLAAQNFVWKHYKLLNLLYILGVLLHLEIV